MLKKEKIKLILITENDAEFILVLRKDQSLNKYISKTDISVEKQKEWIRDYKKRENSKLEFYFMITYDKTAYGTVRVYNIGENEAEWGSWILSPKRPDGLSLLSAYLSFEFCFDKLKLKKLNLKVNKENLKAIHLYEKFGFEKYNENEEEYFYFLSSENFVNRSESL